MAMTDYFSDCTKIETKMVADGYGGFETIEYKGISFKGLAVKKGSNEQLIGALRGLENTSYNFHTFTKIPLKKDDVILFIEHGENKYIRLTSSANFNPEKSMQNEWCTYDAESYISPGEVI